VEALFLEALERDPAERAAFLEGACAGDQELRAEVESLVASSRKDSAAISGPAMRRIGHYEIRSLLGAGGMGEVYRAYDTRLRREVAIKVLPPGVTGDPSRLARFEREARALAAVNHANIAVIYGVEDLGGDQGHVTALILELVEGETLAEHLARTALPIAEAVRIAGQIVDALDAAHQKGVVHRDLKPANIKLTRGGSVKVLDFGLAKTPSGALGIGDTGTEVTAEGTIVGTPAYMSPEQARGQNTDRRTDVWAFGCVLFEMLTGVSAFGGKTATDTIAAVIERDPDWSRLPTTTPPAIKQLLQRALEKDPERRLDNIADARALLTQFPALSTSAPRAVSSPARHAIVVVAALIVMAAIGFAVWRFGSSDAAPVPLSRFAIELPSGEPMLQNDGGSIAASPDGRYLAFSTIRNGRPALYLRPMDREPRLVSEDNAIDPFFSPDSQWIGFFAGGKLLKQPVGGGDAVPLANANTPRGGSWADAGFIVFAGESRTALFRVDANGGPVTPLTTLDTKAGETSHRFPTVLPGSRAVLMQVEGTGTDSHIDVFDIASGQPHVLVPEANTFEPHYALSGHLLYVHGTSLMAAPFDARRLELTGPAVMVQQHVQTYTVSAAGLLAYASDDTSKRLLQWIGRAGTATQLPLAPDRYDVPRLSPDRKHVVLHIDDRRGSGRSIWTYDLGAKRSRRLTPVDGVNLWPVWSRDGGTVIYAKNNAGSGFDLFKRPADGSGEEQLLLKKSGTQLPRDVSKDGVLVYGEGAGQVIELWTLRLADGAQPRRKVREAGDSVAFSPDGQWLAYTSRESGDVEVYVGRSDAGEGKWPVSKAGGTDPRWNPNGRELFYRQGNKLVAVSVTNANGLPSFGRPEVLFDNPAFVQGIVGTNYDVDADGQRFLAVTQYNTESSRSIQVTTGWFSELNALSPTK